MELIKEPYSLIWYERFCERLLGTEPLIAKKFGMKGSEKSIQSLLDVSDESENADFKQFYDF